MKKLLSGWRSLPLTSQIGVGIVLAMGLLALFGPLIAPYDPEVRSGPPFARPSAEHWLGTDDTGHDLLSLIIVGARPSLMVGVLAALAATFIGTLVGLTAGYLRGSVDTVLMRLVDIIMSLPVVPLTLVIGVLAGPGLVTQAFVIAIALWAPMARELRSQVLSVRERDFIQALRAMGARNGYVLRNHVVPTVAPLLVPQLVLAVQTAVMLEASLAFLGLGDINTMSWGMILSTANQRSAFLTDAWLWWVVPPGALIALTVLGFALAGGAVERSAGLGKIARSTALNFRALRRKSMPAADAAALLSKSQSAECTAGELLQIEGLSVRYGEAEHGVGGCTTVDLSLSRGQILGLVGESGSGKSTVAAAIIGLLAGSGYVREGRIQLEGVNLLELNDRQRRELRGGRIGLVPQEAQSALNPVQRSGAQIVEAVRTHTQLSKAEAKLRALELLGLVGLDEAKFLAYPHQLSGGQRQRVVIAMALAGNPVLLLADEPTSGLDVLVQEEILELLTGLRKQLGLGIIIVTHDLPVVAEVADQVAVMQAGVLVEQGEVFTVFNQPQHPYTQELLASLPEISQMQGVTQ